MHDSIATTPAAPNGRPLLRLEVRNSQTPVERKPSWMKTPLRTGPEYRKVAALVQDQRLNTVCQEAGCPNIFECWEDREATFLIGGEQCTRRCDFCQIDTGRPAGLDRDEPRRVAESVAAMGLRYSTVTGVARDDLPDGGSWLYAETVRQIHQRCPGTGVELLIPDFGGRADQLDAVFDAAPEVLAHNLETVPRVFRRVRPGFTYERSLDVITQGQGTRPDHEVQPHPGPRRKPRRGAPSAGRPACRRMPARHHHPVPAPQPVAPSRRTLGDT